MGSLPLAGGGGLRRHDDQGNHLGGPPPSRRRSPHNCPCSLPLWRLRSSRTLVLVPHLMGAGAAIGCSVRHGGQQKRARKIWCLKMYHTVSRAKSTLINIGWFCKKKKKRLLSMPLDDHTSSRVVLPSSHPRKLAVPPGLRGLLFGKRRGGSVVIQEKKKPKKRTKYFVISIGGGGVRGKGLAWCMVYPSQLYRAEQ